MANKTEATASGSVNIGLLIERYIAGPDGTKFNSLFEKEIREKLIIPLFTKIESRLQSAPIQLSNIKLDDIVQATLNNIKVEGDSAQKFSQNISDSLVELSANISNITKSKDFITKVSSNLEEATKKSLDSIFTTAFKDKAFSSDTFLKKFLNPPTELSRSIKNKYNLLTSKLLTVLESSLDNISIDKDKPINQKSIFNKLLAFSPEYSFLTRIRIELLANEVISKLDESVKKTTFKIADKPIDLAKIIVEMLTGSFNLDDGWFGLGFGTSNIKQKYKTLVNKVVEGVTSAVDGISINKSPIDLNEFTNQLLTNTFNIAERGVFGTKSNVEKSYDRLVKTLLLKVNSQVKKLKFKNTEVNLNIDSYIAKIVDSFLAPKKGIEKFLDSFSKESPTSIAKDILLTLRDSILKRIKDVEIKGDIKSYDLINLLFKSTLNKEMMESADFKEILKDLFKRANINIEGKISVEDKKKSTKSSSTAPGTVFKTNTISLTDDTIKTLAKKIGQYIDENLDLLTQAEQTVHTANIVRAIKESRGFGESKGSSVTDYLTAGGIGSITGWIGEKLIGPIWNIFKKIVTSIGRVIMSQLGNIKFLDLAKSSLLGGGVTDMIIKDFNLYKEQQKKRQEREEQQERYQREEQAARDFLRQHYQNKRTTPESKNLQAQPGVRMSAIPQTNKSFLDLSYPQQQNILNNYINNSSQISTKKSEEKLDIINQSLIAIHSLITGSVKDIIAKESATNSNLNNYNMLNDTGEKTVNSYNSIRQQRDMFSNFRSIEIT